MPYTTAIFDRTQADISAKNSKAFMNVADWNRIYDNASIVNGLFGTNGYTILWQTVGIPTIASIFGITEINTMLGNIEIMRAWAATYLGSYIFPDSLFVEIKDDWEAGYQVQAPDFMHVNSWEYVIDVLYNILSTWTPPVISGDLELFGSTGYFELIAGGNLELIG